jgi:hypothetical protein
MHSLPPFAPLPLHAADASGHAPQQLLSLALGGGGGGGGGGAGIFGFPLQLHGLHFRAPPALAPDSSAAAAAAVAAAAAAAAAGASVPQSAPFLFGQRPAFLPPAGAAPLSMDVASQRLLGVAGFGSPAHLAALHAAKTAAPQPFSPRAPLQQRPPSLPPPTPRSAQATSAKRAQCEGDGGEAVSDGTERLAGATAGAAAGAGTGAVVSPVVRCAFCTRTFNHRSNLIAHERTHSGARPYRCPHPGCGACFSQSSNMRRHQRLHYGLRPYACSACGVAFARRASLDVHMRRHTGEKPFACDVCLRPFSTRQGMLSHHRLHEMRGEDEAAAPPPAPAAPAAPPQQQQQPPPHPPTPTPASAAGAASTVLESKA